MNNNDIPNKEIKELYKNHFNIGQVGLLDKFEFSKEKIVKAKGSFIYTSNGEKNPRYYIWIWNTKSWI